MGSRFGTNVPFYRAGGEHSLSYSHSKPGSFRLTGSLKGSGMLYEGMSVSVKKTIVDL